MHVLAGTAEHGGGSTGSFRCIARSLTATSRGDSLLRAAGWDEGAGRHEGPLLLGLHCCADLRHVSTALETTNKGECVLPGCVSNHQQDLFFR